MTGKKRTGLLAILLSLLIVALMGFSLTYGRFSEEQGSSGGSYGSDIEYIVADQIEVSNEQEFIGAIENGYTNITISNDAEDSLIITADVTDVGVDLIINLNGHTLVRNNRHPLLNVKEGVRLTIIDSSAGQTGTFYNPVGSVFSISGGTLTVSGGIFESGPRKSEYDTQSNVTETVNATVHKKSADGASYITQENCSMPKLDATQTGVYFESGVSGNAFVLADTYLYYTEENAGGSIVLKPEDGSADFYYSYEDGDKQVFVYGYNGVKGSAEDADTNYSIVSMVSGNVYIRGGSYYSYFGIETTYGIYADGGYMAVETGTFSVIEDGTCICCNYDVVSDKEYLRIAAGTFNSEWGDTVQVNGGKLSLTGGSFIKNASNAPSDQTGSAVLRVTNGVLDGTGAYTANLSFTLTGSQLYGIYAEKSGTNSVEVDLEDAKFSFSKGGTKNIGVYTEGGDVALSGVTIDNADLGIYVKSGSVICSSELELTANAGAIRIEGGSFTVEEGAEVTITSGISYTGQDEAWGYDSVYVSGGSLLSYGTLNISHKGVENDDQSTESNGDTLYREFQVKSYAVRVEAGESSSEVEIRKGEITNSCGGGIYIAVGESDSVALGYSEMNDGELVIKSTGNVLRDGYISISGAASNWAYKQSLNGGHAVKVNGGTLTIYGGTYSAAQGDGILVSNGTVDIYGGKFNGNDNYTESDNGSVAGPAASYSFKLYGGTAIIYDGTFGEGSNGSGAFIMGNSAEDMGNATILGGKFVVNGQAGFSIYDYANVVFGEADALNSDIVVSGSMCGIAIENRTASENIKIFAGTFSSTSTSGNCDGIWYSNSNATLEILGGIFTGSVRSGLYFAVAPNGTDVVQLSGGTFTGNSGAIDTDQTIAVTDILASGYAMVSGNNSITSGDVHSNVAQYQQIEIVLR